MALRYWVGGTDTWNATAGTKWSATSGGGGGASVPTTADDVFFDLNSGSGVVTLGTNSTVRSIDFTGFSGTFTFGASLTISTANITLGTSTTYTTNATPTSYTLNIGGNSTLTSNGKVLPINLLTNGSITFTLADNADFSGNYSTASIAHNIKSTAGNTFDLRVGGNISLLAVTNNATDYITIKGYGTSKTYNSNSAAFNIRVSFVSGSSYTSSGTSALSGASFMTVESGGQFVANLSHAFSNNNTVTLSGFNSSNNSKFFSLSASSLILSTDIVVNNIVISSLAIIIVSTGASKLLMEGDFIAVGSASTTIDRLEFSGTTASIVTAVTSTNLRIKEFSINKTGGGSLAFNTSGVFALTCPALTTQSWTHTAGTVTQSSSCTIRFNNGAATSQIDYSAPSSTAFTFYNLEVNAGTINLTSPLSVSNDLIISGSVSFTGSNGWTCGNLLCTGSGRTITLKNSITYTTTLYAFLTGGTSSSRIVMTSDDPAIKAIWTLSYGASQSLIYVNGTRIDSSLGQTVWTFGGTTTDTINWNPGTRPGQKSFGWVS